MNDCQIDNFFPTFEKTIEAIARIERFIVKYGSSLNSNQKERISCKLEELQKIVEEKKSGIKNI